MNASSIATNAASRRWLRSAFVGGATDGDNRNGGSCSQEPTRVVLQSTRVTSSKRGSTNLAAKVTRRAFRGELATHLVQFFHNDGNQKQVREKRASTSLNCILYIHFALTPKQIYLDRHQGLRLSVNVEGISLFFNRRHYRCRGNCSWLYIRCTNRLLRSTVH